jgi:hypothetical protein
MSNWSDQQNRQAVLEGRRILERTTASLARSNQVAIETEQVGTEVLGELGEQRETLLRSVSANIELHSCEKKFLLIFYFYF